MQTHRQAQAEVTTHQMIQWTDSLFSRPCGICAAAGWCQHREIEVYRALLSRALEAAA